jgi:serine/threonine protein kinase
MSSERWLQVEALYHAALELNGEERERFLNEKCGGDAGLRDEVQSLLLHGSATTAFFDTPAAELETYGSDDKPSLIGTLLGAYEIKSLVGVGGMGRVYRAHDPRLGRDVAIKILDERFTARFEREVRAVAALNHPNIGTLHDIGSDYLVMEFVEGHSLATRLLQRPLAPGLVLHYGIQIAEALSVAHDKGVVHRDLKPENVLVTARDHVKLVDFGLALIREPHDTTATGSALDASGMTQPGTVLGTLAYMSPEQVRGESTDSRTDLFSLGVLLYEAATGTRAFARSSPAETIAAILKEEPPAIEGDRELDAVVRRCLVKDVEGRAQTAHKVGVALRAIALTRGAEKPGSVRHDEGLVKDYSVDPAWAPDGEMVVYSGPDIGTTFAMKAANASGPVSLPSLTLTRGARRVRFLPQRRALVVMRGEVLHKNLWLIDLATRIERQLTDVPADFHIRDFDVSPDGSQIVLERVEEDSDVVLLEVSDRQ